MPRGSLWPLCFVTLVLACGGRDQSETLVSGQTKFPQIPTTGKTSVAILVNAQATLRLTPRQAARLAALERAVVSLNGLMKKRIAVLRVQSARELEKLKGADLRASGMRGMRGIRRRGQNRSRKANAARRKVIAKWRYNRAYARALRSAMVRNNQVTLARAWVFLDAAQRKRAAIVLDRHGHDVAKPELATAKLVSVAPRKRVSARSKTPTASNPGVKPPGTTPPLTVPPMLRLPGIKPLGTKPPSPRLTPKQFFACVTTRLGLSRYQALRFEELFTAKLATNVKRDKINVILDARQRGRLQAVVKACRRPTPDTTGPWK